MRVRDYFSNNFETEDHHYIDSLRTRYYRSRNEDARQVAMQLIKEEKGVIKSDDPHHFEIVYDCKNYSATFTIVSPKVSETAIDIKITTFYLVGMGRGKNIIERLYKYFDSKLPFKGVSLYQG